MKTTLSRSRKAEKILLLKDLAGYLNENKQDVESILNHFQPT